MHGFHIPLDFWRTFLNVQSFLGTNKPVKLNKLARKLIFRK